MNTGTKEEEFFYTQYNEHEKYEYADDDEVMKISKRMIEQHREAYQALANA